MKQLLRGATEMLHFPLTVATMGLALLLITLSIVGKGDGQGGDGDNTNHHNGKHEATKVRKTTKHLYLYDCFYVFI